MAHLLMQSLIHLLRSRLECKAREQGPTSASAGSISALVCHYCNLEIHDWKLRGDSIREIRGMGRVKEDAGWTTRPIIPIDI